MSHAKSTPAIGQTNDSTIGTFEMTRKEVRLNKLNAMRLFSNCDYLPVFENKIYNGWDIAGLFLQPTPINYEKATEYYQASFASLIEYHADDKKVVIEQGVMKSGVLDKKAIAAGAVGGIYHLIHDEYGAIQAMRSMFDMQQGSLAYSQIHGFSVGMGDIMLSKESLHKINEIESQIIKQSEIFTEKLNNGELIAPLGKTLEEFYEEQQINILRIMNDFDEPIFKSLDVKSNGLLRLVLSGSKGKINHVHHIGSAVGQILINGERIRENLSYHRALPFFRRFETAPIARGYATNNYTRGLNSVEVVANSMAARFDLISKALSTSITGEQNRKSVKNLESIIITNIRSANKGTNIIQLLYGEDGLDPRYVVGAKFPTVMISDAELTAQYLIKSKDSIYQSYFDEVKAQRDLYREMYMKIEKISLNDPMVDTKKVPVDIQRIVKDQLIAISTKIENDEQIVAGMLRKMLKFTDNISYVYLNEIQARLQTPIPEYMRLGSFLTRMLTLSILKPSVLKTLSMAHLEAIFDKITLKYKSALIDYGTPAGIIAAQSFSEPLVQYMLDAHHRATSGGTSHDEINRTKEILEARPTSKLVDPEMHLELSEDFQDEQRAQLVANSIEVMIVRQFVIVWRVFFESYNEIVHPKFVGDKKWIDEFEKFNPAIKPPFNLVKWCVRITLDRIDLILKNLSIETIINRLREIYPLCYFVYTNENAPEIVIRVYFREDIFKSGSVDEDQIKEYVSKKILETVIRGVKNVYNTKVIKMSRHEVQADGSLKDRQVYAIRTTGTNLYGILKNPNINRYTAQTYSIEETAEILGIKAARARIISEMQTIAEGSSNPRHYMIYANEMTYTGTVTAIARAGLASREVNNVFLRIGFSSPLQSLEEAMINSMEDKIQGTTARLLTGGIPQQGTIYNTLKANPTVVKKYFKNAANVLDEL